MGGVLVTPRERTGSVVPTTHAAPNDKPSALPLNCAPRSISVRSNVSESKATVADLPPRPANTNKVIVFHTSFHWRSYFEASKESNKLVVIYFTAAWCASCRYIEPSVNELAAKYTDVEFVKIDVDELYYGIQSMPTFLFVKKGKELDKITGARKEELHRKIDQLRV